FGNLSVIYKDNLILDERDKKKVVERLQDIVSGTSSRASISDISRKLKKSYSNLTKGLDSPSKNPGKIKETAQQLKEFSAELKEKRSQLETKKQAQEVLYGFEDKLKELKKEKELAQREYEANKVYFVAQQEIEKLNKELDEVLGDLNNYEELEKEKEEIQKQLKELKPVTDKDVEKMEDLSSKVRDNKNRLEELSARIEELKSHHWKKYYPAGRLTFIVAGILIAVGFLGLFNKLFFGSWFLLAAFAAYMFISGKYSEAVKLKELEKENKKHEDILDNFEKELDEMFQEFQLESLKHVREHNKNIHEKQVRLDGIEKQQKTLLRGKGLDQLKEEKKKLEKQLGVEQAKITDEQKSDPPTAKGQRALEKKLDDLSKEIEKANKKLIEAKTKLENIKISQEDVTELEEKIASLNKQEERYRRRAKVYEVISEALGEAQARSLKRSREALETSMSKYIDKITSGKYTDIKLDENFELQVMSSEKGDYVEADVLSTGMIDQLYIVARFGFLQLLYNPESVHAKTEEKREEAKHSRRPVMLLDDPFVNFDEERRDNMYHIIEELSREFQIILFTAVSVYDNWGSAQEI
ncbi:MAG: hypothetical protein R3251_02900, partial [Candidatus Spechtbacterales bacterium]|nr:hypothetical protein [Candidatus Spechtbacterales bacterium]